MNFDWAEWRRPTATLLVHALICLQVCSFGITTTSVSARDQTTETLASQKSGVISAVRVDDLPELVPPAPEVITAPVTDAAAVSSVDINFTNDGTNTSTSTSTDYREEENPKEGLNFKLSPGKPDESELQANRVVNAQILSEEETTKLLKLLPALIAEPTKKFLLPAPSLPPPNEQNRIDESFPPNQQKSISGVVAVQPLKITSKSPVGKVNRASSISVNFSQPMVPVSTQASLESKTPPVSFTPKVEGRWKWFGTQTLTFEPTSKKMPMATTYKISVPAGTISLVGGNTNDADSWTFSTPTPQIVSHYPDGFQNVGPQSLIMARFNQKIDIDGILPLIKINAGGKALNAVKAATNEIAKDLSLVAMLKNAPSGTTIVFKPSEQLPYDSPISVSIGPDIPSAEGPLVTHKSVSFQFRTFGPFRVLPQSPEEKSVSPTNGLTIRFSNPLSQESLDLHNVQITPPIPDVKLNSYGEDLRIDGLKSPFTKYQVHLSDKLSDIYGQPLSGAVRTVNFNVTHSNKQLLVPSDTTVFSSEQKTKFMMASANINQVKINIYSLRPADYGKFVSDRNTFTKQQKPIYSETLKLKNTPDQIVDTNIELGKWLDNNRGSLIVQVSTNEFTENPTWSRICWVQCTNLGLDAITDRQNVLAWVTDLTTGAPIKGAKVCFAPAGKSQITDQHGLATVPIPANADGQSLVANSGKDSAIAGDSSFSIYRSELVTAYHWYVITDRAPYRPGEVINVKGFLRKRVLKPSEDLNLPQGFSSVSYTFSDRIGNQIGKGQTNLNKFGAFDLAFTLPTNVNVGDVHLNLIANNSNKKVDSPSYSTSIPVAEFRRPEFELKVTNEGPSVQVVKRSTTLAATTNYFAGGNLAHTEIRWAAVSTSGKYSPPGWDGYEFGKQNFPYFEFGGPSLPGATNRRTLKSITNGTGKDFLHVDFVDVHPSEPTSVTISATVQDVNRQTWTDETTLLVHPSDLYVGSRLEKSFVKNGESIAVSLVSTNIDGKAQGNVPIAVEFYRSSSGYVDGKWVETKDDNQRLEAKSGKKPIEIALKPGLSGLYKVMTSVIDSSGRRNETINQFWVQGGEIRAEANSDAKFKLQKVMLLPEKKLYKPGDKANILVQSPFAPSEGIATVWRNGLAATIPIHMTETSQTIMVPIDKLDIPGTTVQVDLVGADKSSNKIKAAPAEATGTISLDVSTAERTLNITATPDFTNSEPGKEISVGIDVKDFSRRIVPNAEVTLAIVDDALLSLVDYRFQDPIKTFYEKGSSFHDVIRERENLI